MPKEIKKKEMRLNHFSLANNKGCIHYDITFFFYMLTHVYVCAFQHGSIASLKCILKRRIYIYKTLWSTDLYYNHQF